MGAKVSGCVGPEVNGSTGAEVSGSTGPEVNGATASGDSGKAGPGVNGNAGPGVSSTGVSFFSAATFDVGSTATLFLMAMASGAVVNELVARAFCLQGTFCFQGGIDTDFAKGVGGVARAVAACVRDVTAEFAAMAAGVGAVSAGVGAGIFRRGSADVAAEVAGSSVAAGAAAGDGAIVAAGAGSRVGVSTLTSTGVAGIILVPLGFATGIKTKPALFLLCPDRCGRCSYGGNGRSMVLLRLRLLAARRGVASETTGAGGAQTLCISPAKSAVVPSQKRHWHQRHVLRAQEAADALLKSTAGCQPRLEPKWPRNGGTDLLSCQNSWALCCTRDRSLVKNWCSGTSTTTLSNHLRDPTRPKGGHLCHSQLSESPESAGSFPLRGTVRPRQGLGWAPSMIQRVGMGRAGPHCALFATQVRLWWGQTPENLWAQVGLERTARPRQTAETTIPIGAGQGKDPQQGTVAPRGPATFPMTETTIRFSQIFGQTFQKS